MDVLVEEVDVDEDQQGWTPVTRRGRRSDEELQQEF